MKLYHAILLSLLGHGVLLLPSAGQPLPDIMIAPMQVSLIPGQTHDQPLSLDTSTSEERTSDSVVKTMDNTTATTDNRQSTRKIELAAVRAGDATSAVHAIREMSRNLSRQQAQTRVVSRLHHELKNYFEYPPLARRNGWEGKVVLALDVYLDGRIYNIQLKSGSGHRVLDRSALNAVSRIQNLPDVPRWQGASPLNIALPVIYRLQG